ncbi:hypothetical protein GOP47_0019751 [Adiantum capillus-veneris]|uniref:Uncharacterized protein n=1 Tax=Adiantum capillus-veneris TaxID=13818 RepID=A0A9D4UDB7_ADICA|nr:hypothetical protein GOP47_0019751 [Adiantum capillus-veneris]
MGSFTRFTRYIKDFWKVFVRGENDDLQRQTVSMQEELSRLQSRRLASAKEREEVALNQARSALQKLRDLHDNFIATEKAAADFAAKLGEAARKSLEAQENMREETRKKFFVHQKQQMFAQQIEPNLQSDTNATVSSSIEQETVSQVSKLKASRAADDKDIIFAAMEADESSSHAVEVTAKRNGLNERQSPINSENKNEASASASKPSEEVDNMELMDVPPDTLAQMLEEARKEAQLEEKSHINALSRNKAILEKEIEARETAERAKMPQG